MYLLKKGSVKKATENELTNVDAEIVMHSKYINESEKNLCETLKKAKNNGDLGFEMKIPQTS
jgi:hypothetical protein